MDLNKLAIRKISLLDLDELQAISTQTFIDTFAADNTESDMNEYLSTAFSKQKLSEELQAENSEYYFAELGDQVVGYLKINVGSSQKFFKTESALQIERIYVLQHYQGQKIGKKLFEKALDIASTKQASFIWLTVWEHNTKALAFYKNYGFAEHDRCLFTLGSDKQYDIVMKLELHPQTNPGV